MKSKHSQYTIVFTYVQFQKQTIYKYKNNDAGKNRDADISDVSKRNWEMFL